jgi:GT2 family glycosyltransferase
MEATKPQTSLSCAISIATRNRRADLERTLAVLTQLDPQPAQVLITADGCTDGTVEWVTAHYPQHRLIVNTQPRGSISSRAAMVREADADIVVILDDDSYPLDRDFVARLPQLFEAHPRVAVLSFPQRTDEFPESLTATDFGAPYLASSYVNCASAVRRCAFVEVGGYPEFFFHAYDESDFSLRCAAAGWQIRYEPSLTIRHHYSGTNRSGLRVHHFHARNELWSVILRCPAPQLFAVALFRIARQFGYAWKRGWRWVVQEPVWWWAALRGLPRCFAGRTPLPWVRYRAWMALARRPISDEAEWNQRFGGQAS